MTDTNITNLTMRRLVKDVADLIKFPLSDQGIYYKHSEDNMLIGHAVIIGPPDTLYEYGYYFFEFKFSNEYPIKPPIVNFLTNKNNIRFHPNLYRTGKCCLSILNTWSGEQWSSCQTIRSILLSLLLLFNNKPLLNEPGITTKYKDYLTYNNVIEYNSILIAFAYVIQNKIIIKNRHLFIDIINSTYKKNLKHIKKKMRQLQNNVDFKYNISLYNNMTGICMYKELFDIIEKLN